METNLSNREYQLKKYDRNLLTKVHLLSIVDILIDPMLWEKMKEKNNYWSE